MKKIGLFITVVLVFSLTSALVSCNDEWKNEQFTHLVGFVSPLNSSTGVTDIYVPYSRKDSLGHFSKGDGFSDYKLPVVISGSLNNKQNLIINIAHDSDTLVILNSARFQRRKDLYYKDMIHYVHFSPQVKINSGDDVGLLDLDFNFKNIDMSNKWVLPLVISKGDGYSPNLRKNYNNALLRIYPFNDYSGVYSGTMLSTYLADDTGNGSIVKNNITGYVVNDSTIFFYAGNIDETRTDRKNYKVYASFIGENSGMVNFYSDNPDLDFKVNKQASFRVIETMDEVRPYLMHRYVIINNIDYNFTDYTSVPEYKINYLVKGSLTLERKINTQIPDEDQAIEW